MSSVVDEDVRAPEDDEEEHDGSAQPQHEAVDVGDVEDEVRRQHYNDANH